MGVLQDKLGVSATPPAQAPAASQETPTETPQTGSSSQTVVVTKAGENLITAIKALREIDQNIGLKEAKDMLEKVPFEILKDAKPEEAKETAEKLKTAGLTVELK